jgi:hypothetical protein
MLRSYWVMLIIDVFSRRCIGFAVARGDIDGPIVCRMFKCARANQGLPKYLSTDHDPLYPAIPTTDSNLTNLGERAHRLLSFECPRANGEFAPLSIPQ